MGESHPRANDAFTELVLQVTLSGAQTARLIWEVVPLTQLVVPVFPKKTEKSPESPGRRSRNALSNW